MRGRSGRSATSASPLAALISMTAVEGLIQPKDEEMVRPWASVVATGTVSPLSAATSAATVPSPAAALPVTLI